MGQTPAKFFPWPTPYGQSPDSNVVTQAIAPPPAPQNQFLPLNPGTPSTQSQGSAPPQANPVSSPQSNLKRVQPMFWKQGQ